MTDINMQEMISAIEAIAELENNELTEYWNYLIYIANYESYMNDEFKNALYVEIKSVYEWTRENVKIVDFIETTTKTYKVLEWSNM